MLFGQNQTSKVSHKKFKGLRFSRLRVNLKKTLKRLSMELLLKREKPSSLRKTAWLVSFHTKDSLCWRVLLARLINLSSKCGLSLTWKGLCNLQMIKCIATSVTRNSPCKQSGSSLEPVSDLEYYIWVSELGSFSGTWNCRKIWTL